MMVLSWDERGTFVPFTTAEELDGLLDRVRNEVAADGLPVMVTVLDGEDPEAPALSIGCGGPSSIAVWRAPDGTPQLLSHGDESGDGPVEFTFCGEPAKYPSEALISNEGARAAARDFAATGKRPDSLSWQQP